MDPPPSVSAAGVGSRFVSQTQVDSINARKEEQWKAAYARLGQEPPPRPTEDVYDGRSLAEKLAANKAAKQEEWEERNKLGNLEEDEIIFLDSIMDTQREIERQRYEQDTHDVEEFKQAVAARQSLVQATPKPGSSSIAPPVAASSQNNSGPVSKNAPKPTAAPTKKTSKPSKPVLKGIVVKKKRSLAPSPAEKPTITLQEKEKSNSTSTEKRDLDESSVPPEGPTKKRKISNSS